MNTASKMSDTPSSEELSRLRGLVPLHTLPDAAFDGLVDVVRIESVAKGQMLFKQGDTDHENVYLLEGAVCLLADRAVIERVAAGTDTARFPIAHQLPRQYSVRAESKVRIARIDSRRLSDLLARAQTVDYQVADFDAAAQDDWMSMLLQSPVLQQVPAANIQQVMMNVEQVEVAKDDDLIRQGDPGDYYYMLTRSRAVVRRDHNDGKGPCELATLVPGDAFGEEALLSDSPRNSSVTMLEDGEVLRLSKEHFLQLIHNPLLDQLDMRDAQEKVDEGAIWLDLRSSDQYDESHLPGAINYPFESLRYQASSLVADRHYVLCSNTGGRAMAGAFLLVERGFDVSVLRGGLRQQAKEAVGEAAVTEGSEIDDAAAQERVRQAEARAVALEHRLQEIQRDQESAANERQQHLEQVSEAVDLAKRKLVETEAQKHDALAAEQNAYAEMEQLTSSLEELESERASLSDRMSEIEGLDQQMQKRLAKAERELIGERERAESATSSLEDLSLRLSEVVEKREQEREQHARERGELKEDMTGLQMELEQSRLDIGELRTKLDERLASTAVADAMASDLQRRLAEADQTHEALKVERDALKAEVETLGVRLGHEVDDRTSQRAGEDGRLAAVQAELEGVLAEHVAAEAARGELETELNDLRQASAASTEELRGELGQERATSEALRAELATNGEQLATERAQARARITELEGSIGQHESGQHEFEAAQARLVALEEERRETQTQLAGLAAEQEEKAQLAASLGSAHSGLEEAEAALVNTRHELGEMTKQLERLRNENQQMQKRSAVDDEVANDALERVHSQLADLEQQHVAREQELAEVRSELQQLRAEKEGLETRLSGEHSATDEAAAPLRAEVVELNRRLEGRERALSAAQEEQAELIEALNSASSSREALQLKISDQEDEQARLVDLENQVAEALRVQQSDLLAHEQEQHRLRDQLAEETQQRSLVQQELDHLKQLHDAMDQDHVSSDSQLRTEQAALRSKLAQRESEVEQLRAVLAEHVDQIRAAQGDDDTDVSEVSALRAELEMVRDQAIRDAAQMREQLAAAETQKRRLQQADGREAISHEAMRQRIEALESSLTERQRLLADAEESRHTLEDAMEDTNQKLDNLSRELEKAQAEADASVSGRREAENARDQLQQALYRFQEDAEEHLVTDLRDERLKPSKRALGIDSVAPPRRWLPAVLGASLVLGALEAASFLTGHGELFSLLLRQPGQ